MQSTEYLTDSAAKIAEHNEYFAFGETWIDERRDLDNDGRQDYLFTGKELDPETNLYYFGARYYDAQESRWQSADPILNEYMRGRANDGVFFARNLGLYTYAANAPLVLRDPNGALSGPEAVGVQIITKTPKTPIAIGVIAVTAVVLAGYEAYKLYHELPAVQDAKARQDAVNRAQKGVSETGAKASDAIPAAGGGGAKEPPQPPVAVAAPEPPKKAPGTVSRSPGDIRFSQDSIKAGFKDPKFGSIDDLAAGLKSGRIKPDDVDPIRLVERDGKLITIDNRRLEAFRRAGLDVPTRMATETEVAEAMKQGKFSAGPTGSPTIRVRGR